MTAAAAIGIGALIVTVAGLACVGYGLWLRRNAWHSMARDETARRRHVELNALWDPIAFIEHGTYPSSARVQMPVDALEAVRDAINALLVVEASTRLRPRDDGRPAA